MGKELSLDEEKKAYKLKQKIFKNAFSSLFSRQGRGKEQGVTNNFSVLLEENIKLMTRKNIYFKQFA